MMRLLEECMLLNPKSLRVLNLDSSNGGYRYDDSIGRRNALEF
jgi:hypothetical protein